jgi:hypothetical protein
MERMPRRVGAIIAAIRRTRQPASTSMHNENKRHFAACAVAMVLAWPLAPVRAQANWQLAAGATLEEGGAIELARRSPRWEVALGWVSEQSVLIHYISFACPYAGAPPESCTQQVRDAHEAVDPYAYVSIQRRFEFRRSEWLRPTLGLGLVGQSDTNEYVTTPVNISLSAGLSLGRVFGIEWRHFSNGGAEKPNLGQDTLLLRWQFR